MNNNLFIGDSNVYIFNYFKKFGANIIKFTGTPIKSIVNKSKNYQSILHNINRYKPTDLFLVFGVVDLNFYYYFKKYKENKLNVFEDIENYVKIYVKIVSELNVKNKYIIGILPSPIKDKYFKDALTVYPILTKDIANSIPEEDLLMVNRNKRIEHINYILEKECNKYNINFCNIFSLITKNYKLIKLFSLGSCCIHNIHHRYEYLLLIFLKTCLNFLIKENNFNIIINDLKKNYNEYIKNRIFEDIQSKYTNLNIKQKNKLYKDTKFSKKKILKFLKKLKF